MALPRLVLASFALPFALACSSADPADDGEDGEGGGGGQGGSSVEPQGVPVLGNGRHTPDAVSMTTLTAPGDPLNVPRDLAFNPQVPSELWIVNRGDESTTIIDSPGTESQVITRYKAPGSAHFLAQPAALAFGDNGFWASIHETDDLTQGPNATPGDFMGPTLWTANRDIFDSGTTGHYDMLHNSPLGMGIAWESGNAYWVFDGYHSSITRYDFVADHGPGGEDHSDGIIARYVEGAVLRVENVPSHMEFDPTTSLLWVADTGNNRIVALDTTTGTRGSDLFPNYDSADQYRVDGAVLNVMINGADHGLVQPSGLALHDDMVFVSDYATSTVYAFSKEGALLDYLATGMPPSTMLGLEFDAQGHLFTLDSIANAAVRIAPLPN